MIPIFRHIPLLLLIPALASCFVNGTVQYASKTKDKRFVYALSVFKQTNATWYYYEGGVVFMPNFNGQKSALLMQGEREKRFHGDFYGAFVGYHLSLFPIFRPGVVMGSLLKRDEVYWKYESAPYRYKEDTEYHFSPYFGLSIHAGILSLLWTNTGLGAGLNVLFK